MRALPPSLFAAAVHLGLAACGGIVAPEPVQPVADFKNNRPVVRSEAEQRKYLDLWQRACVEAVPDFAKTEQVIEGAGFLPSSGPRPHATGGGVWTDGTAHATLTLGAEGDAYCTVYFKAPESEALALGLEEIVRSSAIGRNAQPMRSGVLGKGYIVETPRRVLFTIGPPGRSSREPTRIGLHYFK